MNLLTDEENKNYFNTKEYNTIFIAAENSDKSEESLIDVLKEHESNERRLLLIDKLRSEMGLLFLIENIKKNYSNPDLNILIAACWEVAMDVSKHFSFFIDVALQNNFMCVLEVLTIVEEYMHNVTEKNEIETAILKLESQIKTETLSEKKMLLEDLVEAIKQMK